MALGWMIYWVFIGLSIVLSLLTLIVNGLRRKHKDSLWGLGCFLLTVFVPMVNFFYCLQRDVRTGEFEYLLNGLFSFNLIAYLILIGYGFIIYGLIFIPSKLKKEVAS
jgi:hypothetical protein